MVMNMGIDEILKPGPASRTATSLRRSRFKFSLTHFEREVSVGRHDLQTAFPACHVPTWECQA